MSTPRKGTPRKGVNTPSRIPRPGRTSVSGTPQRASNRLSKTPQRSRSVTRSKTPQGTPRSRTKTPAAQQHDQGEEGIVVAIRMRPLNAKETIGDSAHSRTANRVWRVLPQYNSITQTTSAGKPLPERVMGRTFFTFDKTFGEDTSTKSVYDGVAKNIVESVVTGLNGTIFAYGQTSSGKTFTMQGAGSIEEGAKENGGGVVHMAANDIFDHIQQTPDRIFSVRASFIEIYNEEVRDLLGGNNVLQIREDPTRGVFVSSVEEPVTDFRSLLKILFEGEKHRAVSATGMNERSSRSHTIFRITVESKLKGANQDDLENDSSQANGAETTMVDGAVRVSTLNLVDLAGSESVRHTGNTGDRQKEGGKINQSLLTLSRVIVGLGQPNKMHINFRDSKLTRILQPALSGNARMAVVCCATPSELYLEETRSTLLFASRAKLVKTRAQINEVLDDRSLIRRLQKQLAEAQNGGSQEHLEALKSQAANADTAAKEAEEKLRRLKESFLNNDRLLSSQDPSVNEKLGGKRNSKRRRLSEGALILRTDITTPLKSTEDCGVPTPKSVPHDKAKGDWMHSDGRLSPTSELAIVREAVVAKNSQKNELETRLQETVCNVDDANEKVLELETAQEELQQKLSKDAERHSESLSSLKIEFEEFRASSNSTITEKEGIIADALGRLAAEETARSDETAKRVELEGEHAKLQNVLLSVKEQNLSKITEMEAGTAALQDEITRLQGSLSEHATLQQTTQSKLTAAQASNKQYEQTIEKLEGDVDSQTNELSELRDQLTEESSKYDRMVASFASEKETLLSKVSDLEEQGEAMKTTIETLNSEKTDMVESHSLAEQVAASEIEQLKVALAEVEGHERSLSDSNAQMSEELENVGAEKELLQKEREEDQQKLEEMTEEITSVQDAAKELSEEKQTLVEKAESLTSDLDKLQKEKESSNTENRRLNELLEQSGRAVSSLTGIKESLEADLSDLQQSLDASKETVAQLSGTVDLRDESIVTLQKQLVEVETRQEEAANKLLEERSLSQERINELEQKSSELESEKALLSSRVDDMIEDLSANSNKLELSSAEVAKLQMEMDGLEGTIEELTINLNSAKDKIEEVTTEKEALSLQLSGAKNDVVSLEKNMEDLEAKYNESQGRVESLKTTINDLQQESGDAVSKLAQEKLELAEELASRKEAFAALTMERDEISAVLETTEHDLEGTKKQLSDLAFEAEQLQDLHSNTSSQLDQSILEKEAALSRVQELEKVKAELGSELADATSSTKTLQSSINELKQQGEAATASLQKTIDKLKVQGDDASARLIEDNQALTMKLEEVTAKYSAATESLEIQTLAVTDANEKNGSLESDRDKLLASFEEYKLNHSTKIDVLQDEVSSAVQQRDEALESAKSAEKKLEETASEKSDLAHQLRAAQSELAVLEESKSDTTELKQLQEEAMELKQLLVSSNESVDEAREAARLATDDLETTERKLEEALQLVAQKEDELDSTISQLRSLDHQANPSELLREMEQLMEEKLQVEALLEKEKVERKHSEDELREQMGEEQRMIIRTAQSTMHDLESEVKELKELEAANYSQRQEIEELQDLNKRLEVEAEKATASNTALEDELSRIKTSAKYLAEENEHLQSRVTLFETSNDNEIAETNAELSRVKAECYAMQQRALDLEEENKSLSQDKDSALKELDTLRTQFHEHVKENKALADKENAIDPEEVKILHKQIKDLHQDLKTKTARITKLEKVRLTSEQVEQLKKVKREHVQLSKQNEKYRAKLDEAEKVIADLRAKDDGSGNDEIASLVFAKNALEKKLRRFATHSQQLENEKHTIIDALKSRNTVVEDDDFAGAVVKLCDQLSSLEEECEHLSNSEQKATSYLVEMDRLRDEKERLESDLSATQDKVAAITQTAQLATATSRRRARSSVADLEAETSRKVKYLEQENLQLHHDLKTAKKQVQSARTELDILRMKALEDTEDYGSLALSDATKSMASGSSGASLASNLASPMADKENNENVAPRSSSKKSVSDSSKKRRFSRPMRSSTRKKRNVSGTPGKQVAPGLGEAGVEGDDTAECRQS